MIPRVVVVIAVFANAHGTIIAFFILHSEFSSYDEISHKAATRVSLLRVFFFLLFFSKRTSVALFKLWEVEDYIDLGTPCPRNLTFTFIPKLF